MPNRHFKKKLFFVEPKSTVKLNKISTQPHASMSSKEVAQASIAEDSEMLKSQQERLYAESKQSLVIILQGMDAAGKDGCIEHVFSGVNPQGCSVTSFKAPNAEELEHHYLWRPMRYLPPRGKIAIFNRSYYEEVIVVRVHPEFLNSQRVPKYKSLDQLWKRRFEEIREFEQMLHSHGTQVVKFFLHVSPEEQLKRLLARLDDPNKHWKFNAGDLEERKKWSEYQTAFEELLPATSTPESPWYVIPADSKWYARAVVADLIAQHLEAMKVDYPKVPLEVSEKYTKLAEQLRLENPSFAVEKNELLELEMAAALEASEPKQKSKKSKSKKQKS